MSTSADNKYFRDYQYCAISSDEIENVEKYTPGGYHPVDIGDVISSDEHDYEVVHKFGYGGFATVWLVRSGAQSTSYHALKILCADRADYADPELAIFQHLKKVAATGHPNVVELYDSFKITGPNGEHKCLVLPVLGPGLTKLWASTTLSSAVRRDMCRQVASATAFLHQHGVCHGGKL
ncbi:hypothetical protein SEPCBS57363_006731 [Sporothrix epigloea]|uniref:non-specific serine/threonine protein kinase n=1 Tax=Sporothrix epigloea TaxID=1892477 RepID=A0ABP0E5V8_9PEZI